MICRLPWKIKLFIEVIGTQLKTRQFIEKVLLLLPRKFQQIQIVFSQETPPTNFVAIKFIANSIRYKPFGDL